MTTLLMIFGGASLVGVWILPSALRARQVLANLDSEPVPVVVRSYR